MEAKKIEQKIKYWEDFYSKYYTQDGKRIYRAPKEYLSKKYTLKEIWNHTGYIRVLSEIKDRRIYDLLDKKLFEISDSDQIIIFNEIKNIRDEWAKRANLNIEDSTHKTAVKTLEELLWQDSDVIWEREKERDLWSPFRLIKSWDTYELLESEVVDSKIANQITNSNNHKSGIIGVENIRKYIIDCVQSHEIKLKLFTEYLLKENKDYKYILIITKESTESKTSITAVETTLIVDTEKADKEIIENIASIRNSSFSNIIHSEVRIVKSEENIASAAANIYEEYLRLLEENIENKISNYASAIDLYNSMLIPHIYLFPSESFNRTV